MHLYLNASRRSNHATNRSATDCATDFDLHNLWSPRSRNQGMWRYMTDRLSWKHSPHYGSLASAKYDASNAPNAVAGRVKMCIPRGDSFRTRKVILPLVPFYESRGGKRGSCAEACPLICSHQEGKANFAVSADGKTCSCVENTEAPCPGPEDVRIDNVCYNGKFHVDGNVMEATNYTVLTGGSVHVFGDVALSFGQDRLLLDGVDATLEVVPCPACQWYERRYTMKNSYNNTVSGMDTDVPGVQDL